ncbi:hypothetical protein MN033_03685 [Bacillus nitratireducens]|uniref:hypothetical protein n=1 Tax=Bacillus nitratireducens TaxID=2026193 RepID=UPI001F55D07F|nr:hypothetical protein [Bacillus nitratireducens]UNP77306.1 hypothetical protein MN033_03685 [Bacillus nitratireducens]
MKKFGIRLFFIFTLILLGGCTIDKKNDEQQIVNKAEKVTIEYFKEKENLEVTLTSHKFAPNDFQTVFINGHVKDDKSKTFSVDVEYGGGEYRISSMYYSKNLELKN